MGSHYGGVGQVRRRGPASKTGFTRQRRAPSSVRLVLHPPGRTRRLQNRARYVEQVESLRHDLKCLKEERLEAMACGDMQELATLDAAAPEYRWKLEATQDMVEFLTGVIDNIRLVAAHQRRWWGAPILPP